MKFSDVLSDEAVLAELGERIARRRIDLQLTQAEVADQAGISKRTLERIESGEASQLPSVVRVLRVLGWLPRLEQAFPESGPGPMELLERRGKARQRVSTRRRSKPAASPWTWDDEQ
jgi:transcriptional regulator with XRE-family HTH domain